MDSDGVGSLTAVQLLAELEWLSRRVEGGLRDIVEKAVDACREEARKETETAVSPS